MMESLHRRAGRHHAARVDLGVNSFAQLSRRTKPSSSWRATRTVTSIGDGVLFHLEQKRLVSFVGRPPVTNWLEYHASTGGYDVRFERDERALERHGATAFHRYTELYRFQVAGAACTKGHGEGNRHGPCRRSSSSSMGEFIINGQPSARPASRHGGATRMGAVGTLGGRRRGARGDSRGRAVSSTSRAARAHLSEQHVESGWIPSPLPAVYSGDDMRPFREWLPADAYEAVTSIGGSFVSKRIEDYYLTPSDLGYGSIGEVRPRLHRPRGASRRSPARTPRRKDDAGLECR